VSGTASITLTVDATGKQADVSIASENSRDRNLGKGAVELLKQYSFIPAYRNGKPVDATTTLTVYFPSP
jgi:TonB family protein